MSSKKLTITILFNIFIIVTLLQAQDDVLWKVHDTNRPKPLVVTPPKQYLPVPPPSDAIVLFDGKGFTEWESTNEKPIQWIATKDYFECVKETGYIKTKKVSYAKPIRIFSGYDLSHFK